MCPYGRRRMVYAVNRSRGRRARQARPAPRGSVNSICSSRADGTRSNDRTKGYFESAWGRPDSWDDVILQGPHLFVATPDVQVAEQDDAAQPGLVGHRLRTARARRHPGDRLQARWRTGRSTTAPTPDGAPRTRPASARDYYRVAWRGMAANTGERTLIPAIVPPGCAHVNRRVYAAGRPSESTVDALVCCAGFVASLISDFAVRVAPK